MKSLVICYLMIQALAFAGGNPPVDEKVTGVDHKTESITGVGPVLQSWVEHKTKKAQETINSAKIDLEEATSFLEDHVPNTWGAETVKEKIREAMDLAETKLKEAKTTASNDYVKSTGDSLAAVLKELDAKALFQGAYSYTKSNPSDCEWKAIAANPGNISEVTVKGKGGIQFRAGVAVGFSADANFALSVGGSVGFKVPSFNPVYPTEGKGTSIAVRATPLYNCPLSVSIGAKALIEAEFEISITPTGILEDVNTTLKIP